MRLFQRTVGPRANVVPERITASSLIYIANDRNLSQPSGTNLLAPACLWQRHVSLPLRLLPQSALPSHQDLAYGTRVSAGEGGALFSPHSPGQLPPAGTHLIMRPTWRRGHNSHDRKGVQPQVQFWGWGGGEEDEDGDVLRGFDEDRPTDVSVQKEIFV